MLPVYFTRVFRVSGNSSQICPTLENNLEVSVSAALLLSPFHILSFMYSQQRVIPGSPCKEITWKSIGLVDLCDDTSIPGGIWGGILGSLI